MKTSIKVYHFLLLAAVICFLSALIFRSNDALDIAVHDTYYVIANTHLIFFTGLSFLVFYCIYVLLNHFRRKTIRILDHLHTWISILSLLGFWICSSMVFVSPPKRYYDYSIYNEFDRTSVDFLMDINIFITILALAFVIAQVIFLINVFIALLRKNEKTSNS